MKKSNRGFTMIEMMTVAGIVGVVASLTVPAYQSYVARAQVAEAVRLGSAARTPLSEYYSNNGVWPESVAGVVNVVDGEFTGSLTLAAGAGTSEPTALLVATLRDSDIHAGLRGKALHFSTADGGRTWTCASPEIDKDYLPGACR